MKKKSLNLTPKPKIDESNIYLSAATFLIAGGVYFYSPPASLIIVGIIFFGLAIMMAQREGS